MKSFDKIVLNFEKGGAALLTDGTTIWVFSLSEAVATERAKARTTVHFVQQLEHFISNSLSSFPPMFYIFVVVEHLTQLWPLLLFAFTSIAVCHLAAKYTSISGSTVTATLTTAHSLNSSTINSGKLGKEPIGEQYCAPGKLPRFEFIHPPITVINNTSFGRNLLNKKEAPPSTIKESSESSQTIDDQDSDKGCEKVVKLLHFCASCSRCLKLTTFCNKRCFLSMASAKKLSVAGFLHL
ncbi:hypothetical protein WUBG_02345 [Wuchereria bancrofti]|uniref:Uncharacterized protein n=1 Tax=Wuchereria bancrofti TaxID=6293 RepID=J9EVX6_WUCBA|nr:hypothetical protein WUBG_02345 [Wuchereria bancrofti]VDM08897.1 unnamed protein product [Wuchereria bancrofti]